MFGVYRHVVVDPLCPALHLDQTVDGRQLAPQHLLALGVLHRVDTADVIDGDHAVGGGGWKGDKIRFRT